MRKSFYFILIIAILQSCVPKTVRDSLKDSYSYEYTGLDTIIRTDGFYYRLNDNEFIEKQLGGEITDELLIQDFMPVFVFFPNGLLRIGIYPYILSEENVANGFQMGYYKLCNDTLKVRGVQNSGLNMVRAAEFDFWFVINDANELILTQSHGISMHDSILVNEHERAYRILPLEKRTYAFHSWDKEYDINKSWLIQRQWFWKNKKAYKQWKKKARG